MLATLGFTVTGICFGIFAYTFNSLVVRKTNLKLERFSYAYYFLALAMLTWGIAAAIGHDVLKNSVLLGNAFLLLGTLCLLDIWLGKKSRVWLGVATLVAGAALFVRATSYAPAPYMRDGVLIFNTQTPVAIGLALVFAAIWLPVNLKVARLVTRAIKQESITSIYSAIYMAATVSALIFLAARRTITVVLSFAAIGICFAMLVGSNLLVAKITESRHGK